MCGCVVRLFIVISRFLKHKWPNGAPFHNSKKGKAIPLQACIDPEGSRRMRLPDFKTIGT